ncbi:MAG: hypothetical protein J0H61_14095, partial [Alphaproteobacteria bacterium]|nr:hypothetical protein [Alphaproteobacteria bacterium]
LRAGCRLRAISAATGTSPVRMLRMHGGGGPEQASTSARSFWLQLEHQPIRNRVSLPEFFQQKRGVFSSKWKYLPRLPGKIFPLPAICAEQECARKIRAGTFFPCRRKIDV